MAVQGRVEERGGVKVHSTIFFAVVRGDQASSAAVSSPDQRNASHLSCRTLRERLSAAKNGVDAEYDDSDSSR